MEGIEDYDSDDSTQLQDGIVVVPKENGFLVENTLLIEKIIPHEEKENKGPTLVPLPEPVTIAMDSSSVSVTWVEDFYLPNLCSSQHVDSHCKHRWKGADWSSTMILRSVESKSEDDSEYCAVSIPPY